MLVVVLTRLKYSKTIAFLIPHAIILLMQSKKIFIFWKCLSESALLPTHSQLKRINIILSCSLSLRDLYRWLFCIYL